MNPWLSHLNDADSTFLQIRADFQRCAATIRIHLRHPTHLRHKQMVVVACNFPSAGGFEHTMELFLSKFWCAQSRIQEFGFLVQTPKIHNAWQ